MIQIPLGESFAKLMKMRKDAEDWDPDGQMPWEDETTVTDENGKKFKITTTLHPKEEKTDADT